MIDMTENLRLLSSCHAFYQWKLCWNFALLNGSSSGPASAILSPVGAPGGWRFPTYICSHNKIHAHMGKYGCLPQRQEISDANLHLISNYNFQNYLKPQRFGALYLGGHQNTCRSRDPFCAPPPHLFCRTPLKHGGHQVSASLLHTESLGLLAAHFQNNEAHIHLWAIFLQIFCKLCTVDKNTFLSRAAFPKFFVMTSVHSGLLGEASRHVGISEFEPAWWEQDENIWARTSDAEMDHVFEVQQVFVRTPALMHVCAQHDAACLRESVICTFHTL